MQKRQVGKCEAIYRAIPKLHLQDSNIACTFVQSGYPQNQSKFLTKAKKFNKSTNLSETEAGDNSDSDLSDNVDESEELEEVRDKI